MARNYVEMRVGNGLPCGLADIDADVDSVRRAARFDVAANRGNQRPDRRLLIGCQRQEIGLVPPWDDQAVAGSKWKGVGESNGQIVLGNKVSASQPATENARHGSHLTMLKPVKAALNNHPVQCRRRSQLC